MNVGYCGDADVVVMVVGGHDGGDRLAVLVMIGGWW